MSFTVDADGDQGTLPLPKLKPKYSASWSIIVGTIL